MKIKSSKHYSYCDNNQRNINDFFRKYQTQVLNSHSKQIATHNFHNVIFKQFNKQAHKMKYAFILCREAFTKWDVLGFAD